MSNNFLLFFLPVIPLEFESPNTPEEILLKIKEVCQGINKHEAINVLVFATVDGQTFRIYFGPASQHTIISGNVNACDTGAKIRDTLTQSDGFSMCYYGAMLIGLYYTVYCLFTKRYQDLLTIPIILFMVIYARNVYLKEPIEFLKKLVNCKL
jgi:hypothetical protein